MEFKGSLSVDGIRGGDGQETSLKITTEHDPAGVLIKGDDWSIWIDPEEAPAFAAILLVKAQGFIRDLIAERDASK